MTFVLMQNTSLPKYRPLSSTPKAAYLPVTSYIFLTYEDKRRQREINDICFDAEHQLAKVSSSIFDAESDISSCNFLYLLDIRNLSTRQLIVFIVFSYRRLSDVMCADRHWKLVYRWISAHITLLAEHPPISGSFLFFSITITRIRKNYPLLSKLSLMEFSCTLRRREIITSFL